MKLALVGYGVMGKNHYRNMKKFADVDLVGVCDPVLESGDIEEPVFRDIGSLLDRLQPDAAILAVPTAMHRDMAVRCIQKGVSVLIEKPVAATVEQGDEIREAASAAGVRAGVGHVERFNPVVVALLKELEGRDIYSIAINRIGPVPPRIKDVGVLVDLSVHDIDLIRYLTNKTNIVKATIYKSNKANEANRQEDNAVISMKLENDVVASITTNWLTPFKKRTIEVATDGAYYEANLITQELREYSDYRLNNSYVIRNCFVAKGEPLFFEQQAFYKYVETGDPGNLALIEDGLETLRVLGRTAPAVGLDVGLRRRTDGVKANA
jgi:predicted dehydrogenase